MVPEAAAGGVTMTLTFGDVLLLAGFIFSAGVNYMMIRRHDQDIRDLRKWKHNDVTPRFYNHGLRLGLIEDRLGMDTPALEKP